MSRAATAIRPAHDSQNCSGPAHRRSLHRTHRCKTGKFPPRTSAHDDRGAIPCLVLARMLFSYRIWRPLLRGIYSLSISRRSDRLSLLCRWWRRTTGVLRPGLPQSTRAPGAAAHCGVGIPHGGPVGIGERAFSGTSCLARNLVTRPSKHLEPPIVARRITIV